MYPPASGAGADRRQNLQPEVFILQLVASSAWGMNDPLRVKGGGKVDHLDGLTA